MERHRRGKGKQALLGNHQKCWVWGRNAVLECLAARRWPILDLHLSSALPAASLEAAVALAAKAGLTPCVEHPEELVRHCHSTEHQGYLARMAEFPYADEAAVLREAGKAPAFALLAGVQDPFNFGAMVRSAEVFGLNAVWIGGQGQVGVTSMVARSSAGAVNRVPIVRVAVLEDLAARLAAQGVRLIAASEKADRLLTACDFRGPVAVVIGNEGSGIRPALLAACHTTVAIPLSGRIGSLNAAAAASVFFYEIRRQRLASDLPLDSGPGHV